MAGSVLDDLPFVGSKKRSQEVSKDDVVEVRTSSRQGLHGGVDSSESVKSANSSVERVETGIPGLDGLICGGFPKQSLCVVSGRAGIGKTIFALQFVVHGALRGQPGVFLSLSQDSEAIRDIGNYCGWDLAELERQRKLVIISSVSFSHSDLSKACSGKVYYALKDIEAKRFALDSLSVLEVGVFDYPALGRSLFDISKRLKELGVTSLFVSRSSDLNGLLSCDGVIHLHAICKSGKCIRALEVLKMKNTSHDMDLHAFRTTGARGVEVFPEEIVSRD